MELTPSIRNRKNLIPAVATMVAMVFSGCSVEDNPGDYKISQDPIVIPETAEPLGPNTVHKNSDYKSIFTSGPEFLVPTEDASKIKCPKYTGADHFESTYPERKIKLINDQAAKLVVQCSYKTYNPDDVAFKTNVISTDSLENK